MGHCILEGQGDTTPTYIFMMPGHYCGWMSEGKESSGSITHHRESWESTAYGSNCGVWLNSNFTINPTKYKTLHFKATLGNVRTTYRPEFGIGSDKVDRVNSGASPLKVNAYKFTATECQSTTIEHDLDLSNVTATSAYCYYCGVAVIEITEFWLE